MKIAHHQLRNYSVESALFLRRALVLFAIILLLTSILIVKLYQLQIVRFEDYCTSSNANRIKLVPISPSRGIIYDCNGIPLALNRTIYQLELVPVKVENLNKTITALRAIVDLTDDDIANFEQKYKSSSRFIALPLKLDLTAVQQARFAVNQYRFPGVEVKGYQRRYYPYKSALTHVIGYVSQINDRDLDRLDKNGILPNYAATDNIGKLGIEHYYESKLHGKTGYEEVEVNNSGRVIRHLHEQPPQAGKDITLTLDLSLQQYIKKLLAGSRAAVVVVDPRDGSIRALVSNPSYDPNLFVASLSRHEYQSLLVNEHCPLINRATQGVYPPASTVKPYISVSALNLSVVNKNFSMFDPGWWQLPGSGKRYRDWKRWGHGWLNVTRALEESADTFFYQLAYDMGIDRLSDWMFKFGYGQYTGIDLAEERAGVMPTRQWKIARLKQHWYPGDTIPVGIGQGYWTATPVQMSKALMTLINDGAVRTPHLLSGMRDENGRKVIYHQPEHKQIGNPNADYWHIAKEGMYGVANRPNGTASISFANTPYKAAAKSGTAQVYGLKINEAYNANKITERLRDHKLMTAFAPYENPTVGVVVILENGGVGPTVGTITRQILDHLLLVDNNTTRTCHFRLSLQATPGS
ncbi:Penicillin-binding protein 2 [Candidatus Moranella endobia PCVAL]|uniref:Peptidoglycan D,D-transpeptidase MrdA n=1 Tax=Moranella endobia (strain PCIT) TaxID=903503 RepID=F7XXT7_MOREP|nr:peptidoglycan DD-transpeptidase MrdA [Candidatus Moranella endobia]AEI74913.1 penicillin-binding protein 2 [Candidatus Moranella endobia PCIT]AGJ61160.1 Penicillin-binding protein 2 [Candidatus Moranella endobia PCVAL]